MKKFPFKIIGCLLVVAMLGYGVWIKLQESRRVAMLEKIKGQIFLARDYFPIQVGTQWTYDIRDGAEVHRVTVDVREETHFNGKPVFKLMFAEQASKLLGYDATGLVKYQEFEDGEIELYDPLGVILPNLFGTKARTFHPAYRMHSPEMQQPVKASAEMSFWVEAWGPVRVPAGKFEDTIRVGYYDRWEEGDGSYDISRGSIWFAKGIGIVKISGKETQFDPRMGEEINKETHVLREFRLGNKKKSEGKK